MSSPITNSDSLSNSRIKLALIWPKGFDSTYSIPLPYGYFKNNLDGNQYDILIIDNAIIDRDSQSADFRQELVNFNPDVVGVSSWSPMFPEVLEIFKVAKQLNSNVTTIIGGAHATSYYKKIVGIPVIDFIMRGEAELSFANFLHQLQQSKPDWSTVKGLVYPAETGYQYNEMDRLDDLDVINIPDYDAIQLERYIKVGYRWNSPPTANAPIWITRGCPYRCQYCAAPELNGKPVRTHSVEYMMQWIKKLYHEKGVRWFNIIDDNFTYHVKYAKAFCKAVIALNLKDIGFGTPNGIRMQRGDKELWLLMKQAGWKMLIVAPESGSAHTLELMKKDMKLDIVPGVVRDIRESGLKVQGFFLLGYPGETISDIEESADLIMKCRFNFVFLSSFQPLPGTPVYNDMVARGEIPDGLLPNNYSDSKRAYVSKELENFNFSKFILKTHFKMMLNDPVNVPYHLSLMFKLFSYKLVIKKILLVVWSMIFPRQQKQNTQVFTPMHHEGQIVSTVTLNSKSQK
jgi:anaerobic magnesium-protoporphyrin IX monomethyl ester cyclase